MVTVKHFIYGFILLNSTSFLKCEDDDDSVEEEESILVRGTFDDISSHDVFFLSFITFLVVSSFIIGSAMTCFIQYLTEQINLHILDKKEEESDRTCSGSRTRTTSETTVTGSSSLTVNSIEENDTIDVPLTQEQEEFIANKRETEREWEQETKYSNQGSVTMRSQNVEILDVSFHFNCLNLSGNILVGRWIGTENATEKLDCRSEMGRCVDELNPYDTMEQLEERSDVFFRTDSMTYYTLSNLLTLSQVAMDRFEQQESRTVACRLKEMEQKKAKKEEEEKTCVVTSIRFSMDSTFCISYDRRHPIQSIQKFRQKYQDRLRRAVEKTRKPSKETTSREGSRERTSKEKS
uniref:Uncharacterized protein n=1 Tax=Caenorhabditis tropicalis TaxID=1561998 RepID=A0A1I7TU71_9PELO